MYRFYDTTELTLPREELPSEALCLNGQFIEKMVPGYHTLYTTGREGNPREVSQTESSGRDGARFRSVRRQPREIRVAFQMESRNARKYADKFNALKKLLRAEEAKLVFNDEPDKYFTGTLTDIEMDDTGDLNVRGELVFMCSDPYKYAVHEKTITAQAKNGRAVFEIEYQGTVNAYPLIRTLTLANTDTLLFSDDAGNMVSIGTPDAAAAGLSLGSKILSIDANGMMSAVYPAHIVRYAEDAYHLTPVRYPDGTQVRETINGTQYLTITRPEEGLPDDLIAGEEVEEELVGSGDSDAQTDTYDDEEEEISTGEVTGVTCFTSILATSGTNYTCRVQPLFYADDFRETGYLHFGLAFNMVGIGGDDSNEYAEFEEAEIIIEKTGIGSPYATAYLCIYGVTQKKIRIRVDIDNPVTGKDGYGIGIARFGTVYTFTLGEDQYEIDAAGYYSPYAGQIPSFAVFSLGRVDGQRQMSGMGFASAQIIATTRSSADQLVDIMRLGDNIIVDCATGDIRLNGRPDPDLGSVDNDWTEFCLRPGFNKIECTATTTILTAKKPESYTLTYREAWE